jgi:hypothetical protein
VILTHGNSPLADVMSLLDQGSIVKVQFFAKKSNLLADCTKVTLGESRFVNQRKTIIQPENPDRQARITHIKSIIRTTHPSLTK